MGKAQSQIIVNILQEWMPVRPAMLHSCPMGRAIEHLRTADPRMAGLVKSIGPCRFRYSPPDYCTLARSIVNQQLSGKAAATIYSRILAAAGGQVNAHSIRRLGIEGLHACGASRMKASTLHSLADHVSAGKIDFAGLPQLTDDQVIARLTTVKGIGLWTVQMFLIFALRRPDVLPTGDAGIRNAVGRIYGLPSTPGPREVAEIGSAWHPFASHACWYLWRSLDFEARM